MLWGRNTSRKQVQSTNQQQIKTAARTEIKQQKMEKN